MKKLLVGVVVFLMVATAASYFGLQWRVKKAVDDAFSSAVFIDATYDTASIDLQGRLYVTGIDILVPNSDVSIGINRASLETGSFFNMLTLEKKLDAGELPETLKVSLSAVTVDLAADFIDMLDMFAEPTLFDEVIAFGCGRNTYLKPSDFYDMGIQNLTFDFSMGYTYDANTDKWVGTIDGYFDGLTHVTLDQSVLGLGPIMGSYESALTGFSATDVIPTQLDFRMVDLGYNRMYSEYCAKEAGLEKEAWRTLNRSMLAEFLSQIDFASTTDPIRLYSDLLGERSRFSVSMRPLQGFNLQDLGMYNVDTLVEMLDLTLVVNNESVDLTGVTWSPEKFAAVDTADIRKAYRTDSANEASGTEAKAENTRKRVLETVPVSQLRQHLNRQVMLIRDDNKQFVGELIDVNAQRVVVRTRFQTGFTDLPLERGRIREAKLYPEN